MLRTSHKISLCWLVLSPYVLPTANSFIVAPRTAASSRLASENEKGMFDFLNPYESKIPKEIEKTIYEAEAKTPAAKDRNQRIALYAAIAFAGIACGFFNGFVTELRTASTPDGTPFSLDDAGFGWVPGNPLFKFLFMNKLGGLFCLLGGGAAGLLAEAEFDTRRINAEKIFEEMQRRREQREKPVKSKSKPKRRSGKEKKRLSALSEVAFDNAKQSTRITESTDSTERPETKPPTLPTKDDKGVFGKVKEFYDKADTMAATQALLLNKKLEDEGVIEKITDESGLKVIGKEEASKLTREASSSLDKKQ